MTRDLHADRARAFGSEAAAYDRGRPGYPDEALRACLTDRAERVLDLGAGTGKLTRGLLGLGLEVLALEPLEEMRSRLPREAEILAGRAEELPLPDSCVDAVLVGQAFHWFEQQAALSEIVRVLRPGGTLGLLWNLMDDEMPWVAAIADAFEAEDRASLIDDQPPFQEARGLTQPEHAVIRHLQPLDVDGLVDNVASRSTVILMPAPERADLLDRIRALAPSDRFELPYVCNVWRAGRRGKRTARN